MFIVFSISYNSYAQNCNVDTFYSYKLEGNTYTKMPYYRVLYKYNSNKKVISDQLQLWVSNIKAYRNSSKIETEYSTQFPDLKTKESTLVFDTTNNNWINSTKFENAFDANGNNTLYNYFEWNNTTQSWTKKRENSSVFNVNNKLISYIEQTYVPHLNTVRNYSKDERTYDGSGNEINRTIYIWDTVSNSFLNFRKYTNTYNGNNKKLTELYQLWESTTSSWLNLYRMTITYTIDGLKEYYYNENWNAMASNWYYTSRSQYVYSANQLLITEYSDIWDYTNSVWVQNYKYDYTYNSNYDIDVRTVSKWNTTFLRWDNQYRNLYQYNPNGKTTQQKEDHWISATNSWRTVQLNNMTYDMNDKIIKLESLGWSDVFNALIKNYLSTYQYNTSNPIYVEENYGSYDNILEYYTRSFRNEHLCALANSSINKINKNNLTIYPNPVTNGEISFDIKEPSLYQIFAMDGKMVKFGIAIPNQIINIKELTSGLYSVLINNKSNSLIIE